MRDFLFGRHTPIEKLHIGYLARKDCVKPSGKINARVSDGSGILLWSKAQ